MTMSGRTPAGERRRRAAGVVVIVIAALAVVSADLAAQCVMCRLALNSPEGQQLAGALRQGIVLLVAAPFAVFATIAVLAVRGQQRRAAQEERDERA